MHTRDEDGGGGGDDTTRRAASRLIASYRTVSCFSVMRCVTLRCVGLRRVRRRARRHSARPPDDRVPRPHGNEANRATRPPGETSGEDGGGWSRGVRRLGCRAAGRVTSLDELSSLQRMADHPTRRRRRQRRHHRRSSSPASGKSDSRFRSVRKTRHRRVRSIAMAPRRAEPGRKSIACTRHAACFHAPTPLLVSSGAELALAREA